eukprot:gene13657-19544_t
MGKKTCAPSKLAQAKLALQQAEEQCTAKEKEVNDLREVVDATKGYVVELENNAQANQNLDEMVKAVLANQRQTAAAYSDYENRVLVLELQGLVDRYRMMDVENLAEQNHELREEVFRLQAENMELSRLRIWSRAGEWAWETGHGATDFFWVYAKQLLEVFRLQAENMELSRCVDYAKQLLEVFRRQAENMELSEYVFRLRAKLDYAKQLLEVFRLQSENTELGRVVAEGSSRARRDLAKIELALEITAREKIKEAHQHCESRALANLDDRTRRMLSGGTQFHDVSRLSAVRGYTVS